MSGKGSPYLQFNYVVEWEGQDGKSIRAGFQEVSSIGMYITVAEYREGNGISSDPKIGTGTVNSPNITLKRGLIGASDLYAWLDDVHMDLQEQLKTVTITLLNEDRKDVMKWRLFNARPMKYTGPSLNGKGTDLMIEELVLTAESIKLEAMT